MMFGFVSENRTDKTNIPLCGILCQEYICRVKKLWFTNTLLEQDYEYEMF
jgi:hypothetical protein